jgi:hypothetical protein
MGVSTARQKRTGDDEHHRRRPEERERAPASPGDLVGEPEIVEHHEHQPEESGGHHAVDDALDGGVGDARRRAHQTALGRQVGPHELAEPEGREEDRRKRERVDGEGLAQADGLAADPVHLDRPALAPDHELHEEADRRDADAPPLKLLERVLGLLPGRVAEGEVEEPSADGEGDEQLDDALGVHVGALRATPSRAAPPRGSSPAAR